VDTQLKKGIIDILTLATLRRSNSYGYQLVQDISNVMPINESTLYPVLRRLEAQGMVTTYTREHNSRLRKYYQLTQSGLDRLQEFCGEWNQMQRIYNYIVNSDEQGGLEKSYE